MDAIRTLEGLCALKLEGMLTDEEFGWAKAQLMKGNLDNDDTQSDTKTVSAVQTPVSIPTETVPSNRVALMPSDADAHADIASEGQPPVEIPPVPSFLRRHLSLVPPVEMLGLFLKEQMPVFRKHWVESKRHDGRSLREDMIMLYESQLTTAALLFSSFTSLMFSAVTEEEWKAFSDHEFADIKFWTVTLGTFSCVNSMFYLMFSFVAIMIILPISDQNIYALLKLPSTQRTMTQVNIQLMITFFSGIGFVATLLIGKVGGSWIMIGIIIAIIFGISQTICFTFNHTFNLSMLGGFCGAPLPTGPCVAWFLTICIPLADGSKPVIDVHVAETLPGAELENLLVTPALQYRKEHGFKDPDPTAFYKDKYLASELHAHRIQLQHPHAGNNTPSVHSERVLSTLRKTGLALRKKASRAVL